MPAVWFSEGIDEMARSALGARPSSILAVRLHQSNIILDPSIRYIDFSWVTVPGSNPVLLLGAEWQGSTEDGVATYNYNDGVAWFFGNNPGTQVIYGYVVYNPNSLKAWWGEVFDFPLSIPTDDGSYGLALNFLQQPCS